jgi:hypothetical protein
MNGQVAEMRKMRAKLKDDAAAILHGVVKGEDHV